VGTFDLPGALRRIRRLADLSQRELAAASGLSASTIGRVETGSRDLRVGVLSRLAELAGLRLVLVDERGVEVRPMSDEAVRDRGSRLFPAHLDPRYSDDDWWHGPERYSRRQPWYTFDRDRDRRDARRSRGGTPGDHQLPRDGDSPHDRKLARRRAVVQRQQEVFERLRDAGELPPIEEWQCTCPPLCEELDDYSGVPVHASDCLCLCDVA
jgi:HTH-type transcriptional regulator/antitoxin HipB